MNIEFVWKLFTDCKSEKAARRLSFRHFAFIGQEFNFISVEPYHKGGYVVRAVTLLSAHTWQEAIFQALAQAQATGREWIISGDINNEPDAWSNNSAVAGIVSVHLQVHSCPQQ
jgi:hypothetical protein